jgi:hypothetical protein
MRGSFASLQDDDVKTDSYNKQQQQQQQQQQHNNSNGNGTATTATAGWVRVTFPPFKVREGWGTRAFLMG